MDFEFGKLSHIGETIYLECTYLSTIRFKITNSLYVIKDDCWTGLEQIPYIMENDLKIVLTIDFIESVKEFFRCLDINTNFRTNMDKYINKYNKCCDIIAKHVKKNTQNLVF